jgi:hypothetical protein
MALIHRATLTPTKLELLAEWLPTRSWSGLHPGDEVEIVGRFRFDDPAGEVGVETVLVGTPSGAVLQAPLTYRAEPLAGAGEFLICEMDHSVLGRRWVYDAVGDPVYADTLHRAIVTGGREADLVGADGNAVPKEATAQGSGAAASAPTVGTASARTDGDVTTIAAGSVELVVLRVLGGEVPAGETLSGTWGATTHVLAVARALDAAQTDR